MKRNILIVVMYIFMIVFFVTKRSLEKTSFLTDINDISLMFSIDKKNIFNEYGYSMIVIFKDNDCRSCLEILNYVNELYHLYDKQLLKITGLSLGEKKRDYLDFPIIGLGTIKEDIGFTPLILLFDEVGNIKYVRTGTSARGEYVIFCDIIERII